MRVITLPADSWLIPSPLTEPRNAIYSSFELRAHRRFRMTRIFAHTKEYSDKISFIISIPINPPVSVNSCIRLRSLHAPDVFFQNSPNHHERSESSPNTSVLIRATRKQLMRAVPGTFQLETRTTGPCHSRRCRALAKISICGRAKGLGTAVIGRSSK